MTRSQPSEGDRTVLVHRIEDEWHLRAVAIELLDRDEQIPIVRTDALHPPAQLHVTGQSRVAVKLMVGDCATFRSPRVVAHLGRRSRWRIAQSRLREIDIKLPELGLWQRPRRLGAELSPVS